MNNTKMSLIGITVSVLIGCGENYDHLTKKPVPVPPPIPAPSLIAFEPEGKVKASIKWTEYGVPHITANTLESLGFGSGYAYAKDNICILADQILKVRSERAKYFGPDKIEGSGDNAHILSDFGYKAMQVVSSAENLYSELSENSRALIEGYVTGYNKYLSDQGLENLAPECANQPWVTEITKIDLTAYLFSVSQQASGGNFVDVAFLANPSFNDDYLPTVSSSAENGYQLSHKIINANRQIQSPNMNNSHLGSNAWSIGKDKTESGKGILLANPHFPHTGSLKFWQSHLTIPGVMDVAGAGLQGLPGVVNIGFNNDIAWTHTVSSSKRFVIYQLALNPNNNMEYMIDGEVNTIEKKTFTIDVKVGNDIIPFSKDYFYSHHGLMIETQANMNLLTWDEQWAYTLKDAAEENIDLIDHWLAINLSGNLSEFQQAFKDYDGIPWVNTVYADKEGNSFYIDKSRVLAFNDDAIDIMNSDPTIVETRKALGLDILPGYSKTFEPLGLNSYENAPKLLRADFVQNSNNSYAKTNPEEPLSGYSPLYGDASEPLSLRTRMSLKMLVDSSGTDQKFSASEVESALFSNRAYLAEAIMDELIQFCKKKGDSKLIAGSLEVDASYGCEVLAKWDRRFDLDSKGAHLFREFTHTYVSLPSYHQRFVENEENFDVASHEYALEVSLAIAIVNIQNAGITLDSKLADIQFTEKSLPNGNASGIKYPWAGASDITGGFNIFAPETSDQTLYPIHSYTPAINIATGNPLTSGLTSEGYQIGSGTSWALVVEFTDQGVQARGLLTSSQSANSNSQHFDDQNAFYSENSGLRPIHFNEGDIVNHLIEEIEISTTSH